MRNGDSQRSLGQYSQSQKWEFSGKFRSDFAVAQGELTESSFQKGPSLLVATMALLAPVTQQCHLCSCG